ncbi:MAG TPA: aminomethyl-transferring glycine dehydrogenase subunit GcvPB [Clostridiales bacterium]|jgi:glycine dehydrogenase subunit 2|nr:aminomethyl-transferring glycine dehydrogenase subunit GcvPB [Clostridiales bacterium]
MKLIFERSVKGRRTFQMPASTFPKRELPEALKRKTAPRLPEMSEVAISRHYTKLAKQAFGVNSGFYPLGSCTMKWNPRINEAVAALPGFARVHPLQPRDTVQGSHEVLNKAREVLCEITGMDDMTFQPAAGAHGEYVGLLLMKKYHEKRGDFQRTRVLIPDSAHGTNPASASMVGFTVTHIPSDENGCVNLDALKAALDDTVAGLMLTNPNTMGIFDPNILEITRLVHEAGGLNYYDGANLNAIMGWVRPGDMGFDVIHLNLHKTFSTPHGGGGPGAGPVGCKEILRPYLPQSHMGEWDSRRPDSVGQVRAFFGNFLVVARALTYALTLGKEGITRTSGMAVLNANYLMRKIEPYFPPYYNRICMHEFVISLEKVKKQSGVGALDVAKCLLDYGMHPPTMYFPLNVPEALMVEPTETENRETLDEAAQAFAEIFEAIKNDPDSLHDCPKTTYISRPDEVGAARNPIVRYQFD